MKSFEEKFDAFVDKRTRGTIITHKNLPMEDIKKFFEEYLNKLAKEVVGTWKKLPENFPIKDIVAEYKVLGSNEKRAELK